MNNFFFESNAKVDNISAMLDAQIYIMTPLYYFLPANIHG